MNILFCLTPKNDVAYVYDDYSLRQALEKMDHYRYTALPILNRKGQYAGTLTEGDLLRIIKSRYQLNLHDAEDIPLKEIPAAGHMPRLMRTAPWNSLWICL